MNHIRIFRQYIPTYIVLLVVLEYLAMMVAVYVSYALRFPLADAAQVDFGDVLPRAHIYAAVNLICMIAMGAYRPAQQ